MRVNSSVAVPVEQAQLIDPNSFRFDTSGAKALGQAGAVLQELGKRKVDMQDKIAVSNTNAAMEKAQLDYQQEIIGKPLDQHASILQKHVNLAKSISGGQRMSDNARKLAENKLKIWGNTFAETGELATIKALEKDALIRVTDDYENALTSGTPDDIEEAEEALNSQYASSYTPAEAERLKEKTELRAVAQMEKNAKESLLEAAARVPNAAIDRITAEQENRKKNDPKDFPLSSNQDLLSAKKLAESTITSNKNEIQDQFDTAIGQATTTVTDGIRDNTITEADIWTMEIPVAATKKEDVGQWRDKWATVVRGIESRRRTIQEGKDKKKRDEAYEPALVADLKTRAREVGTSSQIDKIKLEASRALIDNKIDDADLESINMSADSSFDTIVDKELDERDSQFKAKILKGTSSENLAAWIQGQAISSKLAGVPFTAQTGADLMKTFQDVGKAKVWASNESRTATQQRLDRAIELKKDVSVDDLRLWYLQEEKRWLRKSDTEIVREYNIWLSQKP